MDGIECVRMIVHVVETMNNSGTSEFKWVDEWMYIIVWNSLALVSVNIY